MDKITSSDIELAILRIFSPRSNIVVPRVSWGMGMHECDILILTKANYAIEIEIKISIADLKRDKEKKHTHNSNRIKALYFAIPESIKDKAIPLIPERAGIIIINRKKNNYFYESVFDIPDLHAIVYRPPKTHGCLKFTPDEREHLLHLASMRYWSMRRSIYNGKTPSIDTPSIDISIP